MRCKVCGRKYTVKELLGELDEDLLERIAMIRCDRV
ncbi:MAG: hypothetical protein AB1711_07340 [Thermodesulfobacteriota bacterium]